MAQTAKAIGHFTRNEKQTVVLDLGISNNEVLVFDRQSCVFMDKSKMRDSMQISVGNGRPLPFDEASYGNTARARLAAKTLMSPRSNLNGETASRNGRSRHGDFDETKSVRSAARSISIKSPDGVKKQQS